MKIGVLGGGQLGQMMALAGYPLGFHLRFLDRAADAPAGQVAECIAARFEDQDALRRFGAGVDVVTYEFENVPASAARYLSEHVPRFIPPPMALEIAQDRLVQKQFFQRLGIPTAVFAPIITGAEIEPALALTGLPAVLKTRRWGYDGKGQSVVCEAADVRRAWESMGGAPLILESFVQFDRELSLVAVRGVTGETAFYPLTENHHREGILRVSRAPALGLAPGQQQTAESYATKIFAELGYGGVLTIEFFSRGGMLLANEMATRVHNSGHWTIEGAETSQFENHLRAIAGLPLGLASPRGHSAMVNFIGTLPDTNALLAVPGIHLHIYGKSPRRGRKLGHATVCAASPEALSTLLHHLQGLASCIDNLRAERVREPVAR
ncbi:MAG TPA: 5-(carboxyamino)imidazole ribonucleotide synthase [Terriglobia bacterium]|nr:5-(carboxyamino)imidazole ribonucleotide synthase [Terriglobia bacterium]